MLRRGQEAAWRVFLARELTAQPPATAAENRDKLRAYRQARPEHETAAGCQPETLTLSR